MALVCAPGDQHQLPAGMATVALREDHWRVHHLGAGWPRRKYPSGWAVVVRRPRVVMEEPDANVSEVARNIPEVARNIPC